MAILTAEINILDFEEIKELVSIVDEIIRIDSFVDTHTKQIDPKWFELRDDIRKRLSDWGDKTYREGGD